MKTLFLAVALAGGVGATMVSRTPTPELEAVSVSVEAAGDSARIIARWARPCNSKGCAESYRVQWGSGDAASPVKTTTALADTVMAALPDVNQTRLIRVSVTAVRRGLLSTPLTAEWVLRNPDAPPPPVDSLRVDTLMYEAALLDSFPVDVIRNTLGQKVPQSPIALSMLPVSEYHLCYLSRNRYTGEVRVLVPSEAPPDADEAIASRCEVARQLFAAERDG